MSRENSLATVFTRVSAGETVAFRPHGGSMRGRVASGQLVTVAPLTGNPPSVDEIVLCKVRGRVFLHLVKAVRGGSYLIGNNVGGINGWTSLVAGRVVALAE